MSKTLDKTTLYETRRLFIECLKAHPGWNTSKKILAYIRSQNPDLKANYVMLTTICHDGWNETPMLTIASTNLGYMLTTDIKILRVSIQYNKSRIATGAQKVRRMESFVRAAMPRAEQPQMEMTL